MKKILNITAIVAAGILMLTGCKGTDAPTAAQIEEREEKATVEAASEEDAESKEDSKVIYFSSGVSGGAAWSQTEQGFWDACEELGWEGHYLAPQVPGTTADMVNNDETAITNGADILLLALTQQDAFTDVMQRAKDEGIVLVGTATLNEIPDATIGTDPTNLGYTVAETLVEQMGEKEICVVTMQTMLTSEQQNIQVAAFEEKLKELRPDAKIVEKAECNSNASTAQDKLSAIYLANTGANCSVSFDSYAGLGAAAFVEEKGIQEEYCVIGIDDAEEFLRCVKNGTMRCTIAQHWYDVGYQAVMLAKTISEGGDFEKHNDTGTTVVTLDTVDEYASQKGFDLSK